MWSQERAALSLQLHEAQAEAGRVKNELRRTEIQLEREREKYFPPANEVQVASDRDKVSVNGGCGIVVWETGGVVAFLLDQG